MEIADLSRMDVVADVYETDLPRLREGAPPRSSCPARPALPATVREIGWQVRRNTQANTDPVAAVDARTVEVRLRWRRGGEAALRAPVQHAGPGGDPAMNEISEGPCCPGRRSAPASPAAPPRRAPAGRAAPPRRCSPRASPGGSCGREGAAASAIAGVLFACVLVFMQLGFRGALFDSATRPDRRDARRPVPDAPADHRELPAGTAAARPRAAGARAARGGARRAGLSGAGHLAEPGDGSRRAIQLIGVDIEAARWTSKASTPLVALRRADTVAFDGRSRPEFGPVARIFCRTRRPFEVQVGNRMMDVVGPDRDRPVLRRRRQRRAERGELPPRGEGTPGRRNTDLVAIRCAPAPTLPPRRRGCAEMLPPDVVVMTQAELRRA
jgi:putative ABC transport system permease protein